MAPDRQPDPRQLRALSSVAEAGGAVAKPHDEEACDQCLLAGWLAPNGGEGFRLTEQGRATLEAAGLVPEPAGAENRTQPRKLVMRKGAVIHQPTGRSFSCTIVDLSLGGARVQLYGQDIPKTELTLIDRDVGEAHELRVVWSLGPMMGVQFTSTTELPK